MATLINGDGNQAVYAAQDADMLSGAITNNKTVILDVGEKFRAEVLSSSIIEVHDGVILTKEGRRIQLDQNAVDLFEFPAGAQGVVSWYYIGYKLEIDEDSHQICSTFVQKMDSEGDTIPEGSFRDGDQEVYISLYHVQQDTLGVLTPTLVLTENMTMIDVLDNLIGSASDLPDPTKTVTKNIDQINSDLTDYIKKSSLVGSVVNIENYTSDYFICPKNGYIRINGGSLVVRGELSDTSFISVPLGQIVSTFVPEGMQVKIVSMITNGNARYIPWI
jgi:hypothetical protein